MLVEERVLLQKYVKEGMTMRDHFCPQWLICHSLTAFTTLTVYQKSFREEPATMVSILSFGKVCLLAGYSYTALVLSFVALC